MELTYHRNGDYLFPNLVIGKIAEGSEEPIGKYGRLRKTYLKEHRVSSFWEQACVSASSAD